MTDTAENDTSLVSWYVNQSFYDRAAHLNRIWLRDPHLADHDAHNEVERLLRREARLLDIGDLDTWLSLFSAKCLYWVPIAPGGADPRETVSWAFDDRRRLEDRVYWLQTGWVWSQVPPSRTVRQIGNVEVAVGDQPHQYYVRSTFTLLESHPRRRRLSGGWNSYLLEHESEGLRIRIKQANLTDSEQPQQKLTVLF